MKILLEITERKMCSSFLDNVKIKYDSIQLQHVNMKTIIVFLISHHLTHGGRSLETTNETFLASDLVYNKDLSSARE